MRKIQGGMEAEAMKRVDITPFDDNYRDDDRNWFDASTLFKDSALSDNTTLLLHSCALVRRSWTYDRETVKMHSNYVANPFESFHVRVLVFRLG